MTVDKRPRITLFKKDISEITAFLTDGTTPQGLSPVQKQTFIAKASRYTLIQGVLYGIKEDSPLLAVAEDDPAALAEALTELHTRNHLDMKTMYLAALDRYTGFRRQAIQNFIRNCLICQRNQPLKRSSQMKSIVASHRWEQLMVGCIDLQAYSEFNDGFQWIIIALDSYSKFIYALPTKTKSSNQVCMFLESLFYVEGAPKILHTDNGPEFINSHVQELCAKYKIKHARSRTRHLQSQGQVERANQTITRKLYKAMQECGLSNRWIDLLGKTVATYNLTAHRAINTTPMKMFRGRPGFNVLPPEVIVDDDEYYVSSEEDIVGAEGTIFLGEARASNSAPHSQDEVSDDNVKHKSL
ncbi:hypothetical protein NEIG_00109 [Nematocida sp. ERTm5]|nr:hypothetical protein NEIG_00109 [Nematocida sp. ERTm5]